MPIASPDALNNEVPADTINNEDEPENQEEIKPLNKTILSVSLISANNSESEIMHQKSSTYSHKYQKLKKQISSGTSRKTRGGLTLTGPNNLKNLIMYIKSAYSSNLTSPKWKNFKGLKLQVVEKIRLNNVIWRQWFEQYGNKNPSHKKKPSLLLSIQVDDAPVTNPKMAVIEGEYWKRRLSSITNEYKKWRTISRQHVKQEQEEHQRELQQLSRSLPNKSTLPNPNPGANTGANNQLKSFDGNNQYQLNNQNNNFNNVNSNYSSSTNNSFINNANGVNSYYDGTVGTQYDNTNYLK
jgi:hypothetical protein